MMAINNERHEDPPANSAWVSFVLGLLAVVGFTGTVASATKALWGPSNWPMLAMLAVNLLIGAGAFWGLLSLRPSRPKALALWVVLGFAALFGFGLAGGLVKSIVATNTFWMPWPWQTKWLLSAELLIGCAAIWALCKLKLWKAWRVEGAPVSPTTRKANKLLGLSVIVCAAGGVALCFATFSKDHPFAFFSNSPVPVWIGIFAAASWLVAQAINKWWWYFSVDEHERKADDFGNLAAWALFFVVTPAWWVAARAGLVPQPDAMVLWVGAVGVSAIGYFWRRAA